MTVYPCHLFSTLNRIRQNQEEKQRLRDLRAAFGINHAIMSAAQDVQLSFTIPINQGMVILNAFCIIKFHQNLNLLILFLVGCVEVFTLLALYEFLSSAAELTETSIELATSVHRPLCNSKPERPIFPSGRPLKSTLGKSIVITRETVPNVMFDIVVSSVINLLVVFR